jgi:hypothetical protein
MQQASTMMRAERKTTKAAAGRRRQQGQLFPSMHGVAAGSAQQCKPSNHGRTVVRNACNESMYSNDD